MKIHRTLPPASTVVNYKKLYHGLLGLLSGSKYQGKLEEGIREYLGVKHVFFVSSGKAALYLILRALQELSQGKNKVIIPAYTCFSVPSAIIKAGLKVTLCDIDPQTFDFDYGLLEKTMDKDTLCVIPTHLFGIPADMDRVTKICRDKGIFVVEDAAQAMGGRYIGKLLGTIGDVGFFSMGRGKNITCNSGGIIVTNSDMIAGVIGEEYSGLEDPSLLNDLKALAELTLMALLISPSLYWLPSCMPFLGLGETVFHSDFPVKRLSGIKAGVLRQWRKDLDVANMVRIKNGNIFIEKLKLERMKELPYIRLPILVGNRVSRDNLYRTAKEMGLGISMMYPASVNEIAEIKAQFFGKSFPIAVSVAERILTLPTHDFVSGKDIDKICELLSREPAAEV